jgi:hypothetical protein
VSAQAAAAGGVPVVLTHTPVDKWGALHWTPAVLAATLPALEVKVQSGRRQPFHYFDETKPFAFADFVTAYTSPVPITRTHAVELKVGKASLQEYFRQGRDVTPAECAATLFRAGTDVDNLQKTGIPLHQTSADAGATPTTPTPPTPAVKPQHVGYASGPLYSARFRQKFTLEVAIGSTPLLRLKRACV